MTKQLLTGTWNCDAPLTKEEVDEDQPILAALVVPEGMSLVRAQAFIHGRRWEYESISIETYE